MFEFRATSARVVYQSPRTPIRFLDIDLATGEVLWETPVYSDQKGDIHWLNTHAVPTPATDGNLIFVSFDSRLAALDPDGKILWQKNLDPDYVAHSRYGASASVALSRDAVILVRDREDAELENPGFLVAVAKQTGVHTRVVHQDEKNAVAEALTRLKAEHARIVKLRFKSDGSLDNNAAATMTFCDSRGVTHGRLISISLVGRPNKTNGTVSAPLGSC